MNRRVVPFGFDLPWRRSHRRVHSALLHQAGRASTEGAGQAQGRAGTAAAPVLRVPQKATPQPVQRPGQHWCGLGGGPARQWTFGHVGVCTRPSAGVKRPALRCSRQARPAGPPHFAAARPVAGAHAVCRNHGGPVYASPGIIVACTGMVGLGWPSAQVGGGGGRRMSVVSGKVPALSGPAAPQVRRSDGTKYQEQVLHPESHSALQAGLCCSEEVNIASAARSLKPCRLPYSLAAGSMTQQGWLFPWKRPKVAPSPCPHRGLSVLSLNGSLARPSDRGRCTLLIMDVQIDS